MRIKRAALIAIASIQIFSSAYAMEMKKRVNLTPEEQEDRDMVRREIFAARAAARERNVTCDPCRLMIIGAAGLITGYCLWHEQIKEFFFPHHPKPE